MATGSSRPSDGPGTGAVVPGSDDAEEPDVELLAHLTGALDQLRDRHRDILDRRLGLTSGAPETLREIGLSYEVTRERIRQLEARALQRFAGLATRARRNGRDPDLTFITDRIDGILAADPEAQMGRYLRATFPATQPRTLGRFVAAWSAGAAADIERWVRDHDTRVRDALRAEHQQARRDTRWRKFTHGIIWPGDGDASPWPGFTPCRDLRSDGGDCWSEKASRRVGVESGLEQSLVELFDQLDEIAEICEQPLRIDYPWFSGRRRYVPDFALRLTDDRVVIVEGKPQIMWAEALNIAKWNAATRYCAERGWGFLVSDGRRHPGSLVGGDGPADADLLESLTANGPIGWDTLGPSWFGSRRTWRQLTATALTHGFALTRNPLKVHRARRSPWLTALHDVAARPGP